MEAAPDVTVYTASASKLAITTRNPASVEVTDPNTGATPLRRDVPATDPVEVDEPSEAVTSTVTD